MEGLEKTCYPVFLNLAGRICLVVGGGRVAWRKISGLLECGGRVVVVAPRVGDEVETAARQGRLEIRRREFQEADIEDAFLVYAATDRPAVNLRVLELARQYRVLAAAVDASWKQGDFLTPARFHHDGITVAVSSHGRSCCSSRDLKNELMRMLQERKT
jgi:siroheme synthase-like protein